MARKKGRGRRKFGRYIRGDVTILGDLSTLAGVTAILFAHAAAVDGRTWISSVKATWTLSNLTEAFSAGPIVCGISHGDYSVAEIEAWLENTGGWNIGDLVSQEVGNRKIRLVGTFGSPAQALGIVMLNDGREITTKLGWMLEEGQGVKFWCYNEGSAALATTAAELAVKGHANLWPR